MKRFFTIVTVSLLSGLFLLGSGQYTIAKMICIENGHASYLLGNTQDCCKKKGATLETFKKPCCKLFNFSYSLNDFSPSSKISSSPFHAISIIPHIAVAIVTCNLKLKTYFSDLPPPDIKAQLYSLRSLLL